MKVILSAGNADELKSMLGCLNIDVPQRSKARKTHHPELYCIAHFLATLPVSRFLFPLTLTHPERPDFALEMQNVLIGIEHTEAVPENAAHADSLRGKGLGPDWYFISPAIPGEASKTRATLINEINSNEAGDGWVGNSAEKKWAEAMAHYVKAKLLKATANGFTRFPTNWLVVYDNWPLPPINFANAAPLLRSLLNEMKAFDTFDAVFILDDSQMCEIGNNLLNASPLIRLS